MSDIDLRAVRQVTYCALKALFETHPDQAALKAAFKKNRDEMPDLLALELRGEIPGTKSMIDTLERSLR